MRNPDKVQDKESHIIIEGLRKHGRKAYDKALANGISVTVSKGDNIYRVEPNGIASVVGKIAHPKVKISKKTYRLR
jgi:hypothetical protein